MRTLMIISKEKFYYDAFVLAQRDLQKLADVFEQFIDQPTFEIECRDGINRKFDDLAGLLSFENGWSKRIRSLWIRSFDDEKMRRARLRFSAEHVPVYLEIAAETEVATELDGEIAGRVGEMQPMYLSRGSCDFGLALLAGFAAAISAFFAALAFKSWWQASSGATTIVFVAEAACFGLSLAAGWLANRPKGPLFPRASFALGRGIFRKRLLNVLRGGLFLAAVGSLIVSIILNIGI